MARKPNNSVNPRIFTAACAAYGLPEPTPEFMFHPTRKWRIDWYFEVDGKRVGLELEGGVWSGGRHIRPQGFIADMEKYNAMSAAGIILLRVETRHAMRAATFQLVKNILKN